MKIRTDYVSNSSSSSFIVIAKEGTDETNMIMSNHSNDWMAYQIPNEDGHHEFGWEFRNYSSFEDKMNFVGIQLLELQIMASEGARMFYNKNPIEEFERCYEMLQKVCKEKFDLIVTLNQGVLSARIFKNDDGTYKSYICLNDNYYIDHQSCVTEDCCMEMFESEETLYDFLRFEESYIEGGNDNG